MIDPSKYGNCVVCHDCALLIANGDYPDMSDTDLEAYKAAIEKNLEGIQHITLGHDHNESDCFHQGEPCDTIDGCTCDRTDFSSRSCAQCGTTLAGSRHDATFWLP